MGLGIVEDAVIDDGDGGRCGRGGGGESFCSVPCSICLDAVTDDGERAWAKLQCGHKFHLDCIGSAFNVKGAMQCPNCRKVEKGQWLYANGSRSYPELSMDDWIHDEDFYDFSYSEMSFGVHWCPFGQLARLPSFFEEGDFMPAAYHDMLGQQAIFPEPTAASSAAHPCPYIAYFGPVHPSAGSSGGSVSDGSNLSSQWNGPSVANEVPTSYAFPMDVHYHSWEHHCPPFSTSSTRAGAPDQPSARLAPPRSARATPDVTRSGSFMHPYFVGHSSGARPGSSIAAAMTPPYPGSNARARDRVQALQAYYQQQHPNNSPVMRTPVASGTRRSNNHRGLAPVDSTASSSDQDGGFYIFPPNGHNVLDVDNIPLAARLHATRDHPTHLSLNQAYRDTNWGIFHQPASVSDPSIRSGRFQQRQGSERTTSQSQT